MPCPLNRRLTRDLESSRPALSPWISGRDVQPAASQANVDRIRAWLTTCIRDHSHCRHTISGSVVDDRTAAQPLPSRLIEVTPTPRLRDTAGQTGQYFALSYCWGDPGGNTMTKRATLPAFRKQLPLDRLSRTVREAIELVRRLGFRYLWVDALCIVQDDKDEWDRESRRMASVYENALATVVALGADHAGEGLFLSGNEPPPASPLRTAVLPCVPSKGGVVGYVSLRVWPPEEQLRVKNDHFRSRWASRGWVFQERVLSRRMVYFGRWQVSGTCSQEVWYEDGIRYGLSGSVLNRYHLQYFFRNLRIGSSLSRFLPRQWKAWKILSARHENLPPQALWQRVLRDYNTCELSVPSDKLMAVEGLATAFASVTGMTYFAGIWLEEPWVGLAWKTNRLRSKMVPDRGKKSLSSGASGTEG